MIKLRQIHALALSSIVALFISVQPVSASIHGSIVAVGACAYGASYSDGCAGAPAGGTFQNTTAFTASNIQGALRQSGQTYGNTGANTGCVNANCHPPWNVAGVDYAVANTTAIASLADPASTHPSYCSYSATGNGGLYPRLTCSNSAGVSYAVTGLNFAPVGGHGSTQLYFNAGITLSPTITITNNYFQPDVGECSTVTTGGASYAIFSANGTTTATYVVTSNLMDANALPGEPCNAYSIFAISLIGSGSFTVEYNAFIGGWPADTIVLDMLASGGSFTLEYNYGDTAWGGRALDHGEWNILDTANGGIVVASTVVDFNTIFQGSYGVSDGTTLLWLGNGLSNLPTFTNFDMSYNTVVANLISGATLATIATTNCMTYTIDDGTDTNTNPGDILTIDANTCGVPILRGASPQGGFVNLATLIGNTGPGGKQQFYIDCVATASGCTEGHAAGGLNPPSLTFEQSSAQRPAFTTASAVIQANGDATYTNLTISNNYLDATGAHNPGSPTFIGGSASTACTNPPTISGNVDMTTGAFKTTWSPKGTGC